MNQVQPLENSAHDNEASNGYSSTSFMPEFVHRQSVKKPITGPTVTIQQKLQKIQDELFTSISILTPTRLKPFQLRKQLCNYQFERIQRKIESQSLQKFGKAEQQLFKQQQSLILMLMSVIQEFKSSKDKSFYILTKKSSRVFHFHHKLNEKGEYIESTLTICNLVQKMSSELDSDKMLYEKIPNENCEKIVIKNQSINVFWGTMVNKIIENQKHYKSFYLITNFPFPGGCEVMPTELFNGIQNKKEYSYIAKPTTNFIGEQVTEVFRMRIAGLWTLQNIKNVVDWLTEMFGEKLFDLEYQTDRVTQYIKEDENEEDKLRWS